MRAVLKHRTQPRGHTAADERCTVERHVLADLHHGVLMDQHLLGESAETGELAHLGAVILGQPRCGSGRPSDSGGIGADVRTTGQATLAVAAEGPTGRK